MLMSPPKSQWHHQKPWKDTDESKEPLLPNRVKDRRSLFACHLWSRRKRTLKPKPFFPWGIYTYVLVMIIVSGQKLVQDRGIKAFHTTPNSNWDSTTHVIRWYLPYNINTITTSSTQPSHIPRSGRWITPTLTLTTLYKATILEGWHSLTGSSGIGTAKTFPKISFDSARAFKGLSDLTVDSRSLAAKKNGLETIWRGKSLAGYSVCMCMYMQHVDANVYVSYVELDNLSAKTIWTYLRYSNLWCIRLYIHIVQWLQVSIVIVQWVQQQLDSKMNNPAGSANTDIRLPVVGRINKGILQFFIAIFVPILLFTIVSVLTDQTPRVIPM